MSEVQMEPLVITGDPNRYRNRTQRQEGESRPAPQPELPPGAQSFLDAVRGGQPQVDTER